MGVKGSNGGGHGLGPGAEPKAATESDPRSDALAQTADNLGDDDELAPPDDTVTDPPPIAIADLTAACVRFVQGKYGVPLDFSSDTLSLVDQYVRDARAEIALLPQSLDLVAGSIGAYFGEVCRRTFGGVWLAEGDTSTYRLCFSRVFLATNPIGIGREAVLMQPDDLYFAHLHLEPSARPMVEERLRQLPSVELAEYYLPTTRFDVLSMVYEALRGKMIADGKSANRYAKADYNF